MTFRRMLWEVLVRRDETITWRDRLHIAYVLIQLRRRWQGTELELMRSIGRSLMG